MLSSEKKKFTTSYMYQHDEYIIGNDRLNVKKAAIQVGQKITSALHNRHECGKEIRVQVQRRRARRIGRHVCARVQVVTGGMATNSPRRILTQNKI